MTRNWGGGGEVNEDCELRWDWSWFQHVSPNHGLILHTRNALVLMFKLLTIVSMFKSNLLIGIKVIQIRHNHGKGTPPQGTKEIYMIFFHYLSKVEFTHHKLNCSKNLTIQIKIICMVVVIFHVYIAMHQQFNLKQ